jgi:hypothetical protein
MNQEARRQRINEAIEANEAKPGGPDRQRLPWHGVTQRFPVVSLPLDAVLLRANSHRIRAQRESHLQRELLETNPESQEAQDVVAQILRETTGFEDLKKNLDEDGQREPGVITSEGVLINANRRSVALRDLGKGYIEVAVLPEDAGQQEIDELELKLQVSEDYRADYTFSNELLFVEDRIGLGRTEAQVARELGWAVSDEQREIDKGVKKVQQWTRILALVREMREMADPPVPWTFFDDQRQTLIDLDAAYEAQKNTNPTAAQTIKQKRMLAILADTDYRDARKLKDRSPDVYLVDELGEQSEIGESLQRVVMSGYAGSDADAETEAEEEAEEPEGLDILGEEEEEAEGDSGDGEGGGPITDLKPLIKLAAKARVSSEVELEDADGTTLEVDSEVLIDKIRNAVATAAENEHLDTRADDKLLTPNKLLKEATSRASRALQAYTEVKDLDGFDSGKFDELARQLIRQAQALQEELGFQ